MTEKEFDEIREVLQKSLSAAKRKNEDWEEALGLKPNEGSSLERIRRLNDAVASMEGLAREMADVADQRGKLADHLLEDNARLIKANLELAAKFTESEKNGARYLSERDFYRKVNATLRQENLDMRETLNMNPRSVYLSHMEHFKSIGVLNAKIKELEADRELLQKRRRSTKGCLTSERLKAMGLEEQIDKFKAREIVGQMWESELREVLGIAGPHTRGVKIIDTVKSILAAKSWQHYEPEIRKMERERVFRKLTSVGPSSKHVHLQQIETKPTAGRTLRTIQYDEQQMSDFLKEE